MRVKLEDVCERGSSNIKQSDIIKMSGNYPIYGASGLAGKVNFYHQEQPYVAVVKDGAGIGRTTLNPAKSSVIGTMQYLIPKKNVLPEYLFYVVSYMHLEKYYTGATIPHIYFKDYKNEEFNLDNIEKQLEIIDVLGRCKKVIEARKQELVELDSLTKARFVELFGDPRSNPFGFEKKRLKDTCKVITGNTPSRAIAEYYGDYIEWIKTDNIVSGILNPTQATESLSEKGMNVGRTVEKDSILMACIAGSIASIGRVCITDRTVAFNQQINAVVPEQYNILFLYVLFQMSKDYLVEDINMALKGILSKSKLEEKEFIIPPMDLQEQFSDFVKQVNKSKVAVQKALDETQILFDSLMQKYFG
ncbi:restriction endonuclease subunit S [Agathobacter rectalis]|uniref:restriction endonuclease subunit S n=2 Tax=Agathobacter rectalis TaxID=39491 RepID=UPI0021FD053B|nr:restriction endonuclease subunit S [Agathobacter rectalis]UTB43506.1 restriction endonuclease subunit S [Agathobacter rectalis]